MSFSHKYTFEEKEKIVVDINIKILCEHKLV